MHEEQFTTDEYDMLIAGLLVISFIYQSICSVTAVPVTWEDKGWTASV
jgi:hypothetical protein